MQLKKLPLRESHKMVLVVLAALIVIGPVIYFTNEDYGKIVVLKEQMESIRGDIGKAELRIAQIPKLVEERDKWRTTVVQYEKVLPDKANKEELLELFSEMKSLTGVGISSLKVTDEPDTASSRKTKQELYKRVDFQLSMSGDYFQFGSFVNQLENYRRFMAVNSFRLTEPDDDLLHTVTLSGSTFTYQPTGQGVKKGK